MKTIIEEGIFHYRDSQNRFHRTDGPAIIFPKDHPKYPDYRAYFIHGEFMGSNDDIVNDCHEKPFIKSTKHFRKLRKLKAFL